MRKVTVAVLFVLLVPLVFGCSKGEDESLVVAKAFWKAMENRDIVTARSYCTSETANSLQIDEDKKDQDVDISFGRVEIKDGQAHVKTTMVGTNEDGSIMSIPLETILVERNGEWKVDANQTMMSILGGAMGAMMESMKDGMEEMGKAMTESMKSAFEDAESSDGDDG
ncbi:MAG: hypothetical protein JSW58_06590 [Candidatus Latescibacterota bacterium]|nr:MAG: hypothetical protein JSW58_06590 [Candidatus Latescibacterota bacterium]